MDEPSNCSDLNKGSPYGAVIAQGLNCKMSMACRLTQILLCCISYSRSPLKPLSATAVIVTIVSMDIIGGTVIILKDMIILFF